MSSTQVMISEKVLTLGIPTDVHKELLKAQCELNIERIEKNNKGKKISLPATLIECLREYFNNKGLSS